MSKARGEEVRIIAGAVNGGSALVVQGDSTLKTPADFRGKKIATPQLGNTQDVAARAWLKAGGLKITQTGGDAQVLPTANPDQLLLFQQKQVDAVWTVEPWVSRLEMEAGGKVLVDEKDAITTVLVAAPKVVADAGRAGAQIRRRASRADRLDQEKSRRGAEAGARRARRGDARRNSPRTVANGLGADCPDAAKCRSMRLRRFCHDAQSVGFLRDAPDLSRIDRASQ